MKLMKTLTLAALLAASSLTSSLSLAQSKPATPVVTNGQVAALKAMLTAMQAEKYMRIVAGQSRYANEAQRAGVFAKLEKVPASEIYARLAYPMAKVLSVETANEMTRFFNTSYGKKVVHSMYNSRGGLAADGPVATAAERKELENATYLMAKKNFDAAEPAMRSEAFKIIQAISRK